MLAVIELSMDTKRFVGDKTANIYVQFDQPSVAQLQLQVHARSVEPPAGTTLLPGETSAPQESKARILELELKVDQLMSQTHSLRHDLNQPRANRASGPHPH